MTTGRIDSRAWLAWGLASIVPLLAARNPYVVIVILMSVLTVRISWAAHTREGWQWIVRLATVFMAIGVVFNTLTVHSGNHILFTLPDALPLIGGRITLNAVVYGIVSGMAVITLVLVGVTVASGLVWTDLMRSLPERIAPLAVAGSVAWSFLPGASRTFREIRESQAVRGHRLRGVRDMPPLVVPLLGGALDQAITMSEALESRGFGSRPAQQDVAPIARVAIIVALAALMLVAYAVAVGQGEIAMVGLAVGGLAGLVALRQGVGSSSATTRYRPSGWSQTDWIVVTASIVSVLMFLWRSHVEPGAAIFNPYPDIRWPESDILMLIGLAILMTPAFLVAPQSGNE